MLTHLCPPRAHPSMSTQGSHLPWGSGHSPGHTPPPSPEQETWSRDIWSCRQRPKSEQRDVTWSLLGSTPIPGSREPRGQTGLRALPVIAAVRGLPKENVRTDIYCAAEPHGHDKSQRGHPTLNVSLQQHDDLGAGFRFSLTGTWVEPTPVVSGQSGQSLLFIPLPQLLFRG